MTSPTGRRTLLAMLGAAVALPAAGQSLFPRPRPQAQAEVPPGPEPVPETFDLAQGASGFDRWRQGFRARALANGIRAEVFDAAFRGVSPNAEVIRLDRRQAEFTKPIWEYLDTATSDDRASNGRANYRRLRRTVEAIERAFGVPASIFVSIWGMETNYGGYRGDIPVVEALATLAFDGRRRSFGEEQLLAALRILQAGDVSPSRMVGSWAGAMGHTQFIPTSYLAYAVDFTGDGRRDVWADDPTDALASAANYLSRAGWNPGQPWGVEVVLPRGFSFANADLDIRRPAGAWTDAGVRTVGGDPIPSRGNAAIFAPAGGRGPAFAVYDNFRVIKRYNNANSYALAVGHLADRINGKGGFAASWPRGDRALSRAEVTEMQRRLTARGFDTGGADGKIGPNTLRAIRAFQSSIGEPPDGYATSALLDKLR
jgi:membrane-bound lytic murein transglycosylase B